MNSEKSVPQEDPQTSETTPASPSATVSAETEAASSEQVEASTSTVATESSEQPVESTESADSPDVSAAEHNSSSTNSPSEPEATTEKTSEESRTTDAAPPEGSQEAKKRFELKPSSDPQSARPVPSIGSQTGSVAPVSEGPVEVPAMGDADVEAEVAKAISGMGGDQDTASETDKDAGGQVALPEKSAIDSTIEAAIEEAMSGSPATAESTDSTATSTPDLEEMQPGQKLTGTVQSTANDFVFVDFGLRLSGAVPVRQFGSQPLPDEGTSLEVLFDQVDEDEGLIIARLPGKTVAVTSGDWDLLTKGQMVECTVSKTNKGGLEVKVGSLRGFIPASQIELGFAENMDSYVGRKLTAEVTELKPEKRNLVLSRRRVLKKRRDEQKKEVMGELRNDQIRTGVVKTIKEYGAFVDLGGVDGFLPISQMSWIRIEHPNELIREGQEIEIKVLSIDREKEKISLGMRQLTQNPWRVAESKYEKGSSVTGRVTRVEPFGAFVELEPGIEGLVHISELDHRRVKRVTEILNVDDMAEVQILEVDSSKKRISLSVKALTAKPEPADRPKADEPPVEKYERKRKGPLKGGTGSSGGGGLFGNPTDFGK